MGSPKGVPPTDITPPSTLLLALHITPPHTLLLALNITRTLCCWPHAMNWHFKTHPYITHGCPPHHSYAPPWLPPPPSLPPGPISPFLPRLLCSPLPPTSCLLVSPPSAGPASPGAVSASSPTCRQAGMTHHHASPSCSPPLPRSPPSCVQVATCPTCPSAPSGAPPTCVQAATSPTRVGPYLRAGCHIPHPCGPQLSSEPCPHTPCAGQKAQGQPGSQVVLCVMELGSQLRVLAQALGG